MLKVKAMLANAKDFVDANKTKAMITVTSLAATASTFVVGAGAEGENATANLSTDLVNAMSSVDYSVVLTCVVALVPAVFPAVFGLIAVRKGIGFVLGMVRGA